MHPRSVCIDPGHFVVKSEKYDFKMYDACIPSVFRIRCFSAALRRSLAVTWLTVYRQLHMTRRASPVWVELEE